MNPAKQPLTPDEAERLCRDYQIRAHKGRGQTFAQYVRSVYGVSARHAYRLISGKRCGKPNISERLRWAIWERDNFTCHYCGIRQFLSVDHVVPEAQGGATTPDNLVTSCRRCNSRKGTKAYDAFTNPTLRIFRMFFERRQA